MILLKPVRSQKIWGYEDWIASTHKDAPQSELIELAKNYPLLVKIIQADDTLSVQVHPDDKTAVELEGKGSCGKTECWYILDHSPGARLISGFKKTYSNEEIEQAIKNNTLQDLLNSIEVKKGDFIFIPAGTVHAIGGGIRLMEVQQSCNITYRLYDWGRPREIQIEKGIKSIKHIPEVIENAKADNKPFYFNKIDSLPENFECEYFELINKKISGGYSYLSSKDQDCELLFIARSEDLKASWSTAEQNTKVQTVLKTEQIYAVKPGEKVTIEGHGQIIRIKAK